jgi:glutamate/aspartate transport system permease protein
MAAMFESLDFGVVQGSWRYLVFTGMAFTLKLTLYAMLGGIFFGTLLAIARLSSIKPLAMATGAYVNLIRALPLILVIFWFYFLVPYIGQWAMGASQPVKVGAFASCVVTFIMFEACYYCEIMRAGIQSISRGQVSAGYALGLGYWQVMAKVVLPQAFRNMTPLLLTQTIILFQDVSLVYVLSLPDFLGTASKIARRDGRLVEMYLFVAVVYSVMAYALSMAVKGLQKRLAVIR